jgi:hypothetical protein
VFSIPSTDENGGVCANWGFPIRRVSMPKFEIGPLVRSSWLSLLYGRLSLVSSFVDDGSFDGRSGAIEHNQCGIVVEGR